VVNSADSVNQILIIKRAKRRLLGALTILIILIILSFFFVKDEQQVYKGKVDVSFLDNVTIADDFNLAINSFTVKDNEANNISMDLFFIQIGIFSDKKNTEKLSQRIRTIGFKTNMEVVKLSGARKIKLTTQSFKSQKEAKSALLKLKNANFPGIIKKID
jgi:hypothetical protein